MNILSAGTRIGQYEIVSRPMMGGMGVVYFALDHGNDGHPVALKTFRPELLPNREARDRFLREGTAWIDLGSHPHIVRCYKVEYIDPTAFLVLELIAKEQNMPDASLRSWLIPGRPLSLEQALLFALQIARGMQYATEKIPGFVHRDLKPENVLVGADKLPDTNINLLRVTDFGLSKTLTGIDVTSTDSNETELRPNQIQFTRGVGTPLYMAPEQWKGEPVGMFTDIYAFGCIFYEMLVGQYAAGKKEGQWQEAHCSGKLQPYPKSLPNSLESLLERCLALKTDQRFGNWVELINIIERVNLEQRRVSAPRLAVSVKLSRDERTQAGWSYNAMGSAYLDIGKAEESISCFEKTLSIFRETGNQEEVSTALSNLGMAYAHMGKAEQAIDYYEQALVMDRTAGSQRGEGYTLNNLGMAYADLGDATQAIRCFEKSLKIHRETGDRIREGGTLGNLGLIYKDIGEIGKSINYYGQYLSIAREFGKRREEGIALTGLGLAYARLGDIRQAITCHEQSLAISREIGDRYTEGQAFGNLGSAYTSLGDGVRAMGYQEQHLAIAREVNDRRGEESALGNLGAAYLTMGDTHHAIGYLEQQAIIAEEIGDKYGEGNALGNLGVAYMYLGEMHRALSYYEKAVILRKEVGNMDGVASDLFNMASLLMQTGNSTRALSLALEAKQIWTEMGSAKIQMVEQLLSRLPNGGKGNASYTHVTQSIFDVFQFTKSIDEMQAAVEQYPTLKDDKVIQEIEGIIQTQVPRKQKPIFEQRLAWLKQIADQQKPGFLARLFGKKG